MEKKFSLEAGKKKKKSKELKSLKFPKNLLELLCSLIITVFTDIIKYQLLFLYFV